jgi:hypothetical protein
MLGLARQYDYSVMPKLLDAMDDPDLGVRTDAATAVDFLLGDPGYVTAKVDDKIKPGAGYQAELPRPEQRAGSIGIVRKRWEDFRVKRREWIEKNA